MRWSEIEEGYRLSIYFPNYCKKDQRAHTPDLNQTGLIGSPYDSRGGLVMHGAQHASVGR